MPGREPQACAIMRIFLTEGIRLMLADMDGKVDAADGLTCRAPGLRIAREILSSS